MFEKLAHLMVRRRWYVVGAWLVILVVAATQARQVGSVLGPGNFVQSGSDSAKASVLLDRKFHQDEQKVTLAVAHSARLTVSDPAFRQTAADLAASIRADRGLRVAYLDNPLVTGNKQLISTDRHSIEILFSSNLAEQDIESQIDHLRSIVHMPGYTTYVIGTAAANHDYAVDSKNDLNRSESITVPILLIILLLVFGTLIAGSLPLLLSACSIVLSLAFVYIFGHFLDTSVYVTNVVTVLGLGVGIDYSLFIVYRFREELEATGNNVEESVVRTMATTGRAVFFSGLTVAIGLSALILTGVSFMESMGLGGMLVPVTALLVAMTLLPAMLAILGTRINRFRVLPRRFLRAGDSGIWHRTAMAIMRHPFVAGGAVLIILLGLAYPVTQLNTAFGGLKNAPRHLESVRGFLYVRQHFPSTPDPVQIVVDHRGPGSVLTATEVAGMRRLEARFRQDPAVGSAIGAADFASAAGGLSAGAAHQVLGRYVSSDERTGIISVVGKYDVNTKQNEDMLRRLRTIAASFDAPNGALSHDAIYAGGTQASSTDWNDALYAHFPLIIAIILLLTYGFLFYAFRSAFLPLKAVLLNLLSVLTAYGMLQLVFQRGIGSGLLGFSPESGVAGWVPVFLFAFLFGLSMDYEVFLLSRVREGWLMTRDNRGSVAFGLEKTGRLITSAAAIMVVAFTGFLIGGQLQLKEFGFGLLSAIAIDASLIRIVLVPSIMRLMGSLNWWVPGFLRGFAAKGVTFGEGTTAPEPDPVSA